MLILNQTKEKFLDVKSTQRSKEFSEVKPIKYQGLDL